MRDVRTAEEARIRDELVAKGLQFRDQATIGTLADFRCEYCGLDFLDPERPENYRHWQWDHIVPKAKGGTTDIENIACACLMCNLLKGQWDPRHKFKDRPNPPSRDELIEAAKGRISEQKASLGRQVQVWREVVRR
jgi:5-methylcytosine-specific restriction endonuclease McrA